MLYYKHGSYKTAFIKPIDIRNASAFLKTETLLLKNEWLEIGNSTVSIFKEIVYSSPWKVKSKPNATASILPQFNGILVISGCTH